LGPARFLRSDLSASYGQYDQCVMRTAVLGAFCATVWMMTACANNSPALLPLQGDALPMSRTAATPVAILADLRRVTPWLWIHCERSRHRSLAGSCRSSSGGVPTLRATYCDAPPLYTIRS